MKPETPSHRCARQTVKVCCLSTASPPQRPFEGAAVETSTLHANLGSTFVKAAFLARLSEGLASHAYITLGLAGAKGARHCSHSADAARPMVLLISSAHVTCAEFSVVDESTLSEMLDAVQEQLDQLVSDAEWTDADEAWSKEVLKHVVGLAGQTARDALGELASGFAVSGGDVGVWQQRRRG